MADRAQPSDEIEDRDPGLARERTDLAWTRTAISYAALGAVMLHTSAIGLVVLATGVGVWVLGQLTARQAHPAARRRLSHRRTVVLITATTTVISVLAFALALLMPDAGIV